MDGAKRVIIGKSSSLPVSIAREKMNLLKGENDEKFPVGPTILSPGPILLNVAATDVNAVIMSTDSIAEIIMRKIVNNAI